MRRADEERLAEPMLEKLQGIPAADPRRIQAERVDISPCGTEGCQWDEDYVWDESEESSEEKTSEIS